MSPDDERHGTVSGYKRHGCRCSPCRGTYARYEKRRKWLVHQGLAPSVPAHGFNRRVRALMVIGWTQTEIAEQLGIASGNLALKLRTNTTVRRASHEAMAEVYERLCMTPDDSVYGRRTARYAATQGWPPPLAWDDIDDPAEEPQDWRYVSLDRAEALTELDALHLGITEVCARLSIRRDNLERWCERHDMREVYVRMCGRETWREAAS